MKKTDKYGRIRCPTSTGKERDEETGYSYFGARYYDSDLSGLFLSVDPMANKYPSISPYAYCAWNPIKLVDPDGREIDFSILEKKNKKGEYVYGNLRKAFVKFANTEAGYRELSKYAKKGQKICGISFSEDGEYHVKGFDISFSHYSQLGNSGVTNTQENGDRFSISIQSSNFSDVGDCLGNIGHEVFIHARQSIMDYDDNGLFDHSYLPQGMMNEVANSPNTHNKALAKAEHKYFAYKDKQSRNDFVSMMRESGLFRDKNSIIKLINGGLGKNVRMITK